MTSLYCQVRYFKFIFVAFFQLVTEILVGLSWACQPSLEICTALQDAVSDIMWPQNTRFSACSISSVIIVMMIYVKEKI